MFRASSRLPRRTLLTASLAATGIVLQGSPERQKLPIYPIPTPEVLLQETPLPLEQEIGIIRRRITGAFRDTHSEVQGLVSRWIAVEHAIESRIKSILSPSESLTPGVLYIGVAGLTGSILARNRGIATRILLPPIFIFASTKHLLPKTTGNLSSYLASLEDTYFPALAQKHDIANAHTRMTWERIKDATQDGRRWVNDGAETAVDKVQELTGLKLKETLGWTKAEMEKMESKVLEVAKKIEEKEIKLTLDRSLDEVKSDPPKTEESPHKLV